MLPVSWSSVFCSVLLSLLLLDPRTGASSEGSSMGFLSLPYMNEPALLPRVTRVSEVKAAGTRLAGTRPAASSPSRRRRNIFYQAGLRLCGQDTEEQVLASHLSYFHLRVCQETVWEAFKIFWDRLPEQDEYQRWMGRCQDGSATARDIGEYFSTSEEHRERVEQKLSHSTLKSEPTTSWQHMCSTPTPETPAEPEPAGSPDTGDEAEEDAEAVSTATTEENSRLNDITVQPTTAPVQQQVVEMSILLTGELFSDDLHDPASLHFQTLSRHLVDKIEDALEELPGFRSVSVIDFRPQKDNQGTDGVVADYAVTVLVDGDGVSSEQIDYLTLQSNLVENSYREVRERSTVVYSRNKEEESTDTLPIGEPESVSEVPALVDSAGETTVGAIDDPSQVWTPADDAGVDVLPEPSETNTVSISDGDVVVLEESELVTPAGVLISSTPEDFQEEGLLLEETGHVIVAEEPEEPEEPPPEPSSTEPPAVATEPAVVATELPAVATEPPAGGATLPEPPVETEASGSHEDNLPEPPTTTAEEETVPRQNPSSENTVMVQDISNEEENADDAAAEEEPGEHGDEAAGNEIPEDTETSTTVTETTEEEDLVVSPTVTETTEDEEEEEEEEEEGPSAAPPLAEDVDLWSEASESDAAETSLRSDADEIVMETPEEPHPADAPPSSQEAEDATVVDPQDAAVNPQDAANPEDAAVDTEEDAAIDTENPALKDEGSEETAESDGEEEEEKEETVVPDLPEISTEDLTEDEILPASKSDPEPSVTNSPASPQPTSSSPEKESPFTLISVISQDPEDQPEISITTLVEVEDSDDATTGDDGHGVVSFGFGLTNLTEEGSTGFPFGVSQGTDQASIAVPVNPGRALIVFFSLRVTNMVFSDDLFNKSSPEYKALEQRFLELLVPYLQSNLTHFENLEILNFRNGSIVVNSRMKFGRPVARGVTTTVYLILEDFCNTAYQTMNLAIDKYSLDVESGDQADPCKFQACNEFAECKVNKWSGEAECVCNAGYFSVDGLPCQSICELQSDFCLNDGKCDVIDGQGAICRCRVGENWWYRGEHCEEYVSEPLVVGIAIASVAGFLLVASGVLFFLARTLRDQYDKDESEDPIRRAESLPSLERATKYNPMFESEATTGYSHYYRRYPEAPVYSSASAEASTDFSSEEIRHIYENSELTKDEIQDRIRIIELYAKDRQFADFVRQHQTVLDTRGESSSTQT